MTIARTLYARRNGGMLFWRLGILGGSFYLSRSTLTQHERRAFQRRLARISNTGANR